MEKKEHLETISKVKKFIEEKDFDGLKVYIEQRELEISEENRSSSYIDELTKELR